MTCQRSRVRFQSAHTQWAKWLIALAKSLPKLSVGSAFQNDPGNYYYYYYYYGEQSTSSINDEKRDRVNIKNQLKVSKEP